MFEKNSRPYHAQNVAMVHLGSQEEAILLIGSGVALPID